MNANLPAATNWLSPSELKTRVERIRQVHKQVMREDIHYGKIFGAAKPSLWQPGAQILLLTFRVSNRPTVIDLSSPDEAKYRVITELYDSAGNFLGTGVGEASSLEEKFMWREAVSDEEFNYYPEDRRRFKFKKGGEKIPQVRTNPADVANTVLKVANKRSLINATCTGLGASEVFTQDAEDLPEDMLSEHSGKRSTKPQVSDTVPVTTVDSVMFKNGTGKDGRPWTKYTIKINGVSYGTFDKKLADAAAALHKEQAEVVFQFEESGKYKNLTSISKAPEPAESEPAESEPTPEEGAPVMDVVDFSTVARELANQIGLKTDEEINTFLKANLKIESLDTVTAEQQSTVIDLFNFNIEKK